MSQAGEVYYRYEDYRESTGYVDVCGEYVYTGSRTRVRLIHYPVLKHTPCGVWLKIYDDKRFVRHSATKRFADATLDEARKSFKARKEKQASIYDARAAQAREAITYVEKSALRPTLIDGLWV